MYNNKKFHPLLQKKNEQKYLKKLVKNINSDYLNRLYGDFEKILTVSEMKIFLNEYNVFINSKIDLNEITLSTEELKEKLAFDIIEAIYSKFKGK